MCFSTYSCVEAYPLKIFCCLLLLNIFLWHHATVRNALVKAVTLGCSVSDQVTVRKFLLHTATLRCSVTCLVTLLTKCFVAGCKMGCSGSDHVTLHTVYFACIRQPYLCSDTDHVSLRKMCYVAGSHAGLQRLRCWRLADLLHRACRRFFHCRRILWICVHHLESVIDFSCQYWQLCLMTSFASVPGIFKASATT